MMNMLRPLWMLQEQGRGPGAVQVPEETPLPGGVADVFRWFFHVPQWVQIGGAVVGAILAAVVAVGVWRRRREIGEWLATRQLALQVVLGAGVFAIIVFAGVTGKASWDYMMHDNDFCTACHVMGPSFLAFTHSEHADLNCHDCHQQPISASMRQMYLWVLERPEEIGEHAPVANEVCAECHIQERPDSVWQRISRTAGHRVHLESDSAALRDVMCVRCHGQQVHEFVPVDQTCGQADCHDESDTRIVLGSMAGQTGFHCVMCHEFTAEVGEASPRDTARTALIPGRENCLSCHEMEQEMAGITLSEDPHGAVCGSCHDPHVQETVRAAFETCTGAGCHSDPAEESSFHRGIGEDVLASCGTCHEAHSWTASGEECLTCHTGGGDLRAGVSPGAVGDAHPGG
ncbi:MAG: hypothetical protein ACOC83_00070 [Gemmatimonadota bacterium]